MTHNLTRYIEVGECHEWQGPFGAARCTRVPIVKTRNTAGQTRNLPAVRLIWEAANGPIPDGRIVYRGCCNPACVRLEHLVLGKLGDQIRARAKAGLAVHAPSTRAAMTASARRRPNVVNTIEQAREVRRLVADGLTDVAISAQTGVHTDMVADIRRGRSWRETAAVASVFSWTGAQP